MASSALYGGLLAIFVLLFFLANIRSTMVIAASIPVSIIATFTLMYFNGMTLNVMSLGGLALGVGMMVDNSIVVLENIFRMKQGGTPTIKACIEGTQEVTGAIIASTVTTVIVFLPMLFVRGSSGIMFKQLALVVTFSLLCSLFVALTIVPMFSNRLLATPHSGAGEAGAENRGSRPRRLPPKWRRPIRKLLHYSLDHRGAVLVAATHSP